MGEEVARRAIANAGTPTSGVDEVVDRLTYLGFLGLETRPGFFAYAEDDEERRRDVGLSRRLAKAAGRERQFRIHSAFHAFLGVESTDV